MTIKEFNKRVEFNGGCDREFGEWKIIDIHEFPRPFLEQHEVDFYCSNGKVVYLLRLRNRNIENYVIVDDFGFGYPTYLIAELPIDEINNEFLEHILSYFMQQIEK